MKVGLASDHKGFPLKKEIENYLLMKGYNIVDFGTDSEQSVDYPIYAFKLANAVKEKKVDVGIITCGTGIGVSIACNRIKNVRCARITNVEDAKMSRLHNDANILAMGKLPIDLTKNIVDTFLTTNFTNEERHIRRIEMLDNI